MSGLAKSTINITDSSKVANNGKKGIACFLGVTERGPVGTPTLVGSWLEYQRTFGGLVSGNDFPLYCKRALDSGSTLYISRVAHYTTISDSSTLTGTKAVATVSTVDFFKAKNIGTWGNNLTVTVAAMTGDSSKRTVTIKLAGYSAFDQVIDGITGVLTADDIAKFNASAQYVDLVLAVGATLTSATYTLSGGAATGSVVDADYTGDAGAGTGVYAFNVVKGAWYLAAPDKAVNAIDVALVNYCAARKDIVAYIRTPVGLTKTGCVQYRTAVSPYAGTAIDSFYGRMWTGGLKIIDPLTSISKNITEIADVLALTAVKDNAGNAWDSVSGNKNGHIQNATDVVYNFGSPALESDTVELVANGINPVINHSSFGIVAWGNRSLLKDQTKLLSYAHVVDLVLGLYRFCKPILDNKLFEPNDIPTWKEIFLAIRPELERLVNERALYKDSKIPGWEYMGDQYVDSLADLKVNNIDDVMAGKYKAFIRLYPINKLDYIELGLDIQSASSATIEVLNA